MANAKEILIKLRDHFSEFRFFYANERALQDGLEIALRDLPYLTEREVVLPGLGRLDFLIEGIVVIETKIGGSAAALMRQVARYAESDQVLAILVVTDRASHRMPETFNGKPLLVHSLLDGAL